MTTIIDGVYALKEKIGEGGMASVYLAEVDLARFDYTTLYAYTQVQGASHSERRENAEGLAKELKSKSLDLATMRVILETQNIPIPNNNVAVKVLTGREGVDRFEGEWKNLLCLNHPNVVHVYGGGVYQKRAYYSMELIENLVQPKEIKKSFSMKDKLNVLIQAGRGVQFLHDNGLIHRDIKPDNLATSEVAKGEYITKVTDLGLGKDIDDDMGLTQTNTIMGSPSYMSPEQIASTKNVDFRTDIYSLGASLFEFVTGYRPYDDKTTVYELIAAVSQGESPFVCDERIAHLPPAMIEIIEKSMAFDPDDRYSTVAEFVDALEAYLKSRNPQATQCVDFEEVQSAKLSNDLKKTKKKTKGKEPAKRKRKKKEDSQMYVVEKEKKKKQILSVDRETKQIIVCPHCEASVPAVCRFCTSCGVFLGIGGAQRLRAWLEFQMTNRLKVVVWVVFLSVVLCAWALSANFRALVYRPIRAVKAVALGETEEERVIREDVEDEFEAGIKDTEQDEQVGVEKKYVIPYSVKD